MESVTIRETSIIERVIASQCSLAVEHPLSKREVVGSNPAIGYVLVPPGKEIANNVPTLE